MARVTTVAFAMTTLIIPAAFAAPAFSEEGELQAGTLTIMAGSETVGSTGGDGVGKDFSQNAGGDGIITDDSVMAGGDDDLDFD